MAQICLKQPEFYSCYDETQVLVLDIRFQSYGQHHTAVEKRQNLSRNTAFTGFLKLSILDMHSCIWHQTLGLPIYLHFDGYAFWSEQIRWLVCQLFHTLDMHKIGQIGQFFGILVMKHVFGVNQKYMFERHFTQFAYK